MTEQARRHHALVIGIDDYRDGPTPLVGCVNDARRMRDLLIDRHGVADDALTLLLDADASQAKIRAALRDLEAHVGPDEGVIVFFAGHGGRYRGPRQVPEVLPDAEGIEVLETLVPADSGRGRAPNRDIADREIDAFVKALNQKTPWVTLILDCCHSGSVSRGPASGAREAPVETRAVPALDAWRTAGRGARVESGAFVAPTRQAVVLAACQAHQVAFPTTDRARGQSHGVLTLCLAETLEGLSGPATWEEVMEAIEPRVVRRVKDERGAAQYPLLEGPAGRLVFGFDHRPTTQHLSVVERTGGRVELSGGAVHGVTVGSRWRLAPTRGGLGAAVTVEITAVDALRARAAAPESVEVGWRATLETLVMPPVRLKVALAADASVPELMAAIDDRPELERVGEGAPVVDVRVRSRDAAWHALGADGRLAVRVQPRAAWADLVADLCRAARARALRFMPLPGQDARLVDGIDFQILKVTDKRLEALDAAPGERAPRLLHGDRYDLRICNRTGRTVYVGVLEFDVDHAIHLMLPAPADDDGIWPEGQGSLAIEPQSTRRVVATRYGLPLDSVDHDSAYTLRIPAGFPFLDPSPGALDAEAACGELTYRLLVSSKPENFASIAQSAARSDEADGPPLGPLAQMMARHARDSSRGAIIERRRPLRVNRPYAAIDRALTVTRGVADGGRQISPSTSGRVLFYKVKVAGAERGEVGISHPSMTRLPESSAFWSGFPSVWPDEFELLPEYTDAPEAEAEARVRGTKRTTCPRFGAARVLLSKPLDLLQSWQVQCQGRTVAWLCRTAGALHWFSPGTSDAWLPRGDLHFRAGPLPVGTPVYVAVDALKQ